MKDKTFADYCMRHGFTFFGDTVIINTTEFFENLDIYEHKTLDSAKIIAFPIFNNMAIEWIALAPDEHGRPYHMLRFEVSINYDGELDIGEDTIHASMNHITCDFDGNIFTEPYITELMIDPIGTGYRTLIAPEVPQDLHIEIDTNSQMDHMLYCLVMQSIHEHAECELITHNRGVRRTTKRKTGKEPSPYFLLKVEPGKTQKRYASTSQKNQHKNRQHIVRGHFRYTADHPIASFNGTFWIPSHMRGNESIGQVQKGYRIVLPDTEEATS